jgi:hypothetical protein
MLSPADFDLLFGRSVVQTPPKFRTRPAFAAIPARQSDKMVRPRGQNR